MYPLVTNKLPLESYTTYTRIQPEILKPFEIDELERASEILKAALKSYNETATLLNTAFPERKQTPHKSRNSLTTQSRSSREQQGNWPQDQKKGQQPNERIFRQIGKIQKGGKQKGGNNKIFNKKR